MGRVCLPICPHVSASKLFSGVDKIMSFKSRRNLSGEYESVKYNLKLKSKFANFLRSGSSYSNCYITQNIDLIHICVFYLQNVSIR
jgi:hypothetical protein